MSTPVCIQVQRNIEEAVRSDHPGPPSAAVVEHIAACDACRGRLMLLAATVAGAPVEQTNCAECRNELAAFIDQEAEQGTQAAARSYPQVWWHVWSCRECAETYHLISALADAEETGQLAPMPWLQGLAEHTRRIIHSIHLRRAFLNFVIRGLSPALGPQRGEADMGDTVLTSDEIDDHTILRSVTARWSIAS